MEVQNNQPTGPNPETPEHAEARFDAIMAALPQNYQQGYIINLGMIVAQQTQVNRMDALAREIKRVDYVDLTEAIAQLNTGGELITRWLLDDQQRSLQRAAPPRTWKLRVLCNEWGDPPKPGDTVSRRIERPRRDAAGNKYRGSAINDMIRRGIWEKEFVDTRSYTVDERGCITCYYEDACHFLREYGVHYATGAGLCGRRRMSGGPCRAPGGSMRYTFYWRFYEVPPDL